MSNVRYPHEKSSRKAPIPDGVVPMPLRADDLLGVMEHYLTTRGLDASLARENGWYLSGHAGDSETRVVIPCVNSRGYAYWQARAVYAGTQKRYQSPSYASTDSLAVVWPRVTGLTRRAVVTEGPMDALAAAELGYVGVGLMGHNPSQDTYDFIIKMFPGFTFLVVPDSDSLAAGIAITNRLSILGAMAQTRFPVGAKDLAGMTKAAREVFFGY